MTFKEDYQDFKKFDTYVRNSCPSLARSFEEMVAMSDNDFAIYYYKLMESFRFTQRWWIDGNNPLCYACEKEILSPQDLRRHESNSYDSQCFRQVIEEENKQYSQLMKKYWEKVLSLEEIWWSHATQPLKSRHQFQKFVAFQ